MILGHIYAAVPVQTILLTYFKIEPDVSYPVVTALQCIGSIAFPIYAFGIAQGCIHTDNALFLLSPPFSICYHCRSSL